MADKTFRATHKFARITARKARPVMDLVRGRGVNEALNTLRFVHRRAAPMISKVIRSALANAGQDLDVDVNSLVVSDARVDDGPLMGGRYRWRPRAMGRVYPIRKRTSHISIVLEEMAEESRRLRRSESEGAPKATKAAADVEEPAVDEPVAEETPAVEETPEVDDATPAADVEDKE